MICIFEVDKFDDIHPPVEDRSALWQIWDGSYL